MFYIKLKISEELRFHSERRMRECCWQRKQVMIGLGGKKRCPFGREVKRRGSERN